MKTRSFKVTLLAALSLLGLGFIAAPTSAEANGCNQPRTLVSHHCGRCGTPVYKSYVIVGYQRCGAPIFRWVVQPHTCRHHGGPIWGGGHHGGGHHGGGHHGGGHGGGHISGGGISITLPFRFGNRHRTCNR